jgi:virulence factor Mce-like protein
MTMALLSRKRWIAIIATVGTLAAVLTLYVTSGSGTRHITAYFVSSVGVYPGSEVRLLGVPIGRVDSVTPEGTEVRIDMSYDATYQLPANAEAVIISPSVVSDRFVQLTPSYSGSGPTLQDHATISLARTRVPVELDEIYSVTNQLLSKLGPQGVNNKGAISRLLQTAASDLTGQGASLGAMIDNLAGAGATLNGSSNDFFATVGHLSSFTDALASNDAVVRAFDSRMADVASFLASERGELSSALQNLASAFGTVDTFVSQNQALLATNVKRLATITSVLAGQREALGSLLRILPAAASNMARAWDPANQSIRARANEAELLKNVNGLLCDALQRAGVAQPTALCTLLGQLVRGVTP